TRHATSKLPDDDLLNINFMGFRGEALPSIASVSDMEIDTCQSGAAHGWKLDCNTGDVRPSDWESGTRVRVRNLFGKTPARLKFLRADRAEMVGVLEVIKRLAMSRPDVGFVLNDRWRFDKGQDLLERIASVMGDDVRSNMLEIDATSASDASMKLSGFISRPTLRRASSVDQYLFVNGRPVKDKVLVGALRAAYMDVMHAREFPLCALYLTVPPRNVDVNVSPAKTEVHFLEPAHVRSFIIKTLRNRLAETMNDTWGAPTMDVVADNATQYGVAAVPVQETLRPRIDFHLPPVLPARPAGAGIGGRVSSPVSNNNMMSSPFVSDGYFNNAVVQSEPAESTVVENPATSMSDASTDFFDDMPLGRVIGQFGNKYILAARGDSLIVVDQHAAHERITYERLRRHTIKRQPLLTPIVVRLRGEDVVAVLETADALRECGLVLDAFGDDAVAISECPADWNLNWSDALHAIADEVRVHGTSAQLHERLHLKLANFACHHSVRAGQKLDMAQMNALLRDIEQTSRGGQCNHGRPVYKIIPMHEIDGWFERA
ncbi:DNA mismatch repair endonuclease MutL, partial [bacterium]|nr:DNA mismatch repair endonuclease MutL [bacterium]